MPVFIMFFVYLSDLQHYIEIKISRILPNFTVDTHNYKNISAVHRIFLHFIYQNTTLAPSPT